MRLTIHRGAKEIGGTCLELSSNGSRILLDCGLPLTGLGNSETDAGDHSHLTGLFTGDPPVQGIVLSHAHPDHAGLICETDSSVPVLATRTSFKMAMAASIFTNQPRIDRDRQQTLPPDTATRIGSFGITPHSVDHSIAGACAFLIEAEGKRVLYTGDLRFHGRKPGMHRGLLKACQERGIDLAITEGTALSRPSSDRTFTEQDLEREGVSCVQEREGLVAAHFSPLNLDRLVSFLRIAKITGRVFVTDAYGAYVLLLARSEGILVPDPFASEDIRILMGNGFWQTRAGKAINKYRSCMEKVSIELDEILGDPGRYLMLWRPSMQEKLFDGSLPAGTLCIRSLWKGYLETEEERQLAAFFQEEGVEQRHLHSSGHASRTDLVKFLEGVDANKIVVVHSESPAALQDDFSSVITTKDGETITV